MRWVLLAILLSGLAPCAPAAAEPFKGAVARRPVTTLDHPDWGGGYAALARASLASIIHATGPAQAREAYGFVEAQTPRMDASYPREPAFAIALATPAKD